MAGPFAAFREESTRRAAVCWGDISSLSLVREAIPHHSRLRRHLPFMLFVLALTSLMVAMARPVTAVDVPAGQTIIILAIDVSRSMCSTDIPPNRLEAAKAAALDFIQRQDPNTLIGVVAFAGFAEVIQVPTSDQELLEEAVASLSPGRRTAVGTAILKSIDAIAEMDSSVAPSDAATPSTSRAEGEYAPHLIVLLTDGVTNSGVGPISAAHQAVARGIRVYTIGFGTANNPAPSSCAPQFPQSELFGNQQFGGGFGGFRRGIDEATLIQIADMSGGRYYAATSAGEL